MKISLSDKQRWSIAKSNYRLNIWHGAVRSGKTVGVDYRFLKFVCEAPKGDLLLIGKTTGSLKRNVINPLLELIGSDGRYQPGKQELHLFDRVIHTVGASDERSEGKIRGMTVAGAYGDELTLWPESFWTMLLSRMSVKGAKFFGTTNPDNPNHWLYKNYILKAKELNMGIFHFAIEDNPYLPKEYVDALKKEYSGLWYKRFILGEWCIAEGAIYDFFDESVHVIDKHPEATYYDVGIDYGTTNPTCFILYGNNPLTTPKIWAEREYYWNPVEQKKQKTDAEFSADFLNFISPIKHKIRGIYCDPAAESFQLQLKRDGVIGIKDADNDVLNGIRTVARMLITSEYAISKNCPEYIQEFYGYHWDPKRQLVGEDKPIKTDDHCQDNGRYVIYTKFGSNKYDISKFVD